MKWVLAALLVLLLAWWFQLGLLVVAAYAVVLLLLTSRGWTFLRVRQLVAERKATAASVEIGEQVNVTVTVRNDGPFRLPWLLIEDSVPASDLDASPPRLRIKGGWLAMAKLPVGELKSLQYEVTCLRRGYYQFGPLLVETGDLFGLYRTYRLLTEPHFVMVYPKVLALESYDIESARPIGQIRLAHRLFEDPTRISGVRPFEPGDPINRIHWRATARSGTLQSKTFESSSVAGATLVLDFYAPSYTSEARYYCSELAVTLAATLARALSQLGTQVGLVTNGRDAVDRMKLHGWDLAFRTRAFAQRGVRIQQDNRRASPLVVETRRDVNQFQRILETLARLELTEELPFHELVAEVGARLPRSATVIAVLSQVNAETAAALGGLRRRGYSVRALVVTFGELEKPNWAAPPEWAARLLQEGIPFHAVPDEAAAAAFCNQTLV